MPWINDEMCTGCGICVDECTAGAISMDDSIAVIDEDKCIRCAVCHDICPEDAVRHDGERIPDEVEANMAWAARLLGHEYYEDDVQRQKGLIERLIKYFNKNKKVMEQTIERLRDMQDSHL
jgi:MinD superfamily P-loop ATPase